MALNFLNDGYFAGKVGIGVESPTNTLHVSGPSTLATQGTVLKIENTADQGSSQDIHIYNQYDRDIGIKFETLGGTNYIWQDSNSDDSLILSSGGTNRTNDATLIINQSHNVFVPNGKVGIGATSADHLLTLQSSGDTILQINRKDDTIAGGNRTGIIQFGARGSWGTNLQTSKIWSYAEETFTSTANGTSLRFFTTELGATSPTEKMIIDTNGNVGIGTTSPDANLEVESASGGVLRLTSSDTTVLTGESIGKIEFKSNDASTSGNNVMGFIDSVATNVGTRYALSFGTGDAAAAVERMRITNLGGISFGSTGTAYGTSGQILKSNGNASPTWIDGSAIPGVPAGSGTGNYLARWTPNGDTLGIGVVYDNGTNVGIGIDDPAARLEVKQNLYVSHQNAEEITFRLDNYGTTGTDAGPLLRMFNQSGTTVVNIDSRSGSSRDTYFNQGGNFGIGVTGPQTKLQVNGDISVTSGDAYRMFNAAGTGWGEMSLNEADNIVSFNRGIENTGNDWKLSENSADSFVCATQGDFGIGTTGPSEKLDVAGNIKIQSALLSNQENTDVDTGTETVASVAIATYTAAFFDFVIKKTTNVRSGTVYACHDGTNVEFTETSTQDLGDTSDVTLSVDISGGNMRLRATTTSDDWSVKSLIRAI